MVLTWSLAHIRGKRVCHYHCCLLAIMSRWKVVPWWSFTFSNFTIMKLNKLQKTFIPAQPNLISENFFYIFRESTSNIGINLSQLNLSFAGIVPDQNTTTSFRGTIIRIILKFFLGINPKKIITIRILIFFNHSFLAN